MVPNHPIWKGERVITCPNVLSSFPISMTTNPVTQMAEAEVNRASMKGRDFSRRNRETEKDCSDENDPGKTENKNSRGGKVPRKEVLNSDSDLHRPRYLKDRF